MVRTLAGFEAPVAVERKSMRDLIGTLFGSSEHSLREPAPKQARFQDELTRMRSHACRLLLMEAHRADVGARRDPSTVPPLAVIDLVDARMVDDGLHVVWAGNRTEAGRILGYVLHRIWEHANGGPV